MHRIGNTNAASTCLGKAAVMSAVEFAPPGLTFHEVLVTFFAGGKCADWCPEVIEEHTAVSAPGIIVGVDTESRTYLCRIGVFDHVKQCGGFTVPDQMGLLPRCVCELRRLWWKRRYDAEHRKETRAKGVRP